MQAEMDVQGYNIMPRVLWQVDNVDWYCLKRLWWAAFYWRQSYVISRVQKDSFAVLVSFCLGRRSISCLISSMPLDLQCWTSTQHLNPAVTGYHLKSPLTGPDVRRYLPRLVWSASSLPGFIKESQSDCNKWQDISHSFFVFIFTMKQKLNIFSNIIWY